ncbi:3-phosphoserine/phosphohydroxythreonine transaminase [Agrilactobacillus fermenti]|uniref:3-phosphoserine/phosphohydroxythreonine transaminase n=1 Tax=Agrilactobacillus fermenti TaxID=2586909 RepID=UPI003A5C332F
MTVYNFAAGPAVLPKTVIQRVQKELPNFEASQMSILEVSHRWQPIVDLIDDTKARLLDLMHLSNVYDVLLLQGGATLQFTAVPLNLATQFHRIGFIDTGHWSQRAAAEAEKLPQLTAEILASSREDHYQQLPVWPQIANKYDYIHLTTNNTIEGTAYHTVPTTALPLVADMSSNFLGQTYDFTKFDLIYAGAQKNLAPAGLTIVVIKKQRIQQLNLPSMLAYSELAAKDSALNTPPVFQIYVANLVLQWLADQGGVEGITRINQRKAARLYEFLDQSQLFTNSIKASDRSLMNVPFTTGEAQLDQSVIQAAAEAGLMNLKGHRSVGGLRASIYNAMPEAGVTALIDFLADFEAKHK